MVILFDVEIIGVKRNMSNENYAIYYRKYQHHSKLYYDI